ncbi:hypothetical protein AAHA92_25156 [Salvia divinorum]|uniref:Uncharacterized protein n=1 Tax=Salvia divinorum TaxID=28513 RepID=A0ABD1GCV6_SALDI
MPSTSPALCYRHYICVAVSNGASCPAESSPTTSLSKGIINSSSCPFVYPFADTPLSSECLPLAPVLACSNSIKLMFSTFVAFITCNILVVIRYGLEE